MLKVYVIKDHKAGAYLTPVFVPNRGLAIRSFADACRDSGNDFSRWPQDYEMFEIGEYDPQTSRLSWYEPEYVVGAVQCLELLKAESSGDPRQTRMPGSN